MGRSAADAAVGMAEAVAKGRGIVDRIIQRGWVFRRNASDEETEIQMSKEKICFVIAPIGSEASEIRKRSDQVFKHVIEPIAAKHGYKAVRADQMSQPGSITTQIVEQILNASLVVADLSGHNANVLYELAIRHVVRKPVVQLIQKEEGLPFDVAAQRTIQIDHRDLDSVEAAKLELSKQITSVEKDPTQVDSPISVAVDLSALRSSTKPVDSTLVEIVSLLREIRAEQQQLAFKPNLSNVSRALLAARRGAIMTNAERAEALGTAVRLHNRRVGLMEQGLQVDTPGDIFEGEGEEDSPDTRS